MKQRMILLLMMLTTMMSAWADDGGSKYDIQVYNMPTETKVNGGGVRPYFFLTNNTDTDLDTLTYSYDFLVDGQPAVSHEGCPTIPAGKFSYFGVTYYPHHTGTFQIQFEIRLPNNETVRTDPVTLTVKPESPRTTDAATVSDRNQVRTQWGEVCPVQMQTRFGKYSKCEAYYSADQLSDLHIGDKITKIYYKGVNDEEATVDAKFWIAQSDAGYPDPYTEANTDTMQLIYDGTLTIPAGGMETGSAYRHATLIEITLAEPIIYQGGGIRIVTASTNPSNPWSCNFQYNSNNISYTGGGSSADNIEMKSHNRQPVAYFIAEQSPKVVSGKVTDKTGAPIANATVSLENEWGELYYEATTDAEGHYAIDVIRYSSSEFAVSVSTEGYTTYQGNDYFAINKDITLADIALNEATITITVGESGYATFCSKRNLQVDEDSPVKFYVASQYRPSTGTLTVSRVYNVPAGQGILIKAEPGTYELARTDKANTVANLLKGTTTNMTINPTSGSYTNFVLAKQDGKVGFYPVASSGTLSAGKAYLQLPTSMVQKIAKSKAISISFDETTLVESIDDRAESEDASLYNLQGQRVGKNYKGIIIEKGKKKIKK